MQAKQQHVPAPNFCQSCSSSSGVCSYSVGCSTSSAAGNRCLSPAGPGSSTETPSWYGKLPGYACLCNGSIVCTDRHCPCAQVGNVSVRLQGIDAPEKAQRCKDAAGRPYSCGAHMARRISAYALSRHAAMQHPLCICFPELSRCSCCEGSPTQYHSAELVGCHIIAHTAVQVSVLAQPWPAWCAGCR